jgi:hypothetical protein
MGFFFAWSVPDLFHFDLAAPWVRFALARYPSAGRPWPAHQRPSLGDCGPIHRRSTNAIGDAASPFMPSPCPVLGIAALRRADGVGRGPKSETAGRPRDPPHESYQIKGPYPF